MYDTNILLIKVYIVKELDLNKSDGQITAMDSIAPSKNNEAIKIY